MDHSEQQISFSTSASKKITNFFKTFSGIVQWELTWVENFSSRKVLLSHWTADILFLNLKETCSLNCKKPVLVAEVKICGLFQP